MKTIKTIPTLMLAASLGAGMILVSEAALARNNDHQEHSDHQDRNGMGSDNGNGSATCSGRDSGATNKNEKSKPGPERGLVLRPGSRLQQPCDLLQAQDHRDLAWLPHEREVPCHLGAVERHGEEETQRRNRAIDARRTHAGLRLMQLEKAKILRRGRIRRAAEKGCKCPDVPDIVVVRLLNEVAHRHVFDHAPGAAG